MTTCVAVQVGDYASEMATWDRPENMTTSRANITISTANSTTATGADLVGNAAAALAAASIVWETTNSTYAAEALLAAKDLYTFAQTVTPGHNPPPQMGSLLYYQASRQSNAKKCTLVFSVLFFLPPLV